MDGFAKQSPRFLGGRIAYLFGALRGLIRYPRGSVSIRVDGEQIFEGPLVIAAAANGAFFGGGMRVAPDALLDDGRLDWILVPELSNNLLLSRLRIVGKLRSLYRGTHIDDRRIRCGRGRVIEAQASTDPVGIEIDGEWLGTLPARIEVVPDAIALFGCR